MKILFIGWCTHPAIDIAEQLIKQGHYLYWVGHGTSILKNRCLHVDIEQVPAARTHYEGPLGVVPVTIRYFSIKSIFDILGGVKLDFDLVFHVHDWTYFTDLGKCDIPYIYYATEPFYPVVPRLAHHVITPGQGMQKLLKDKYGHRYKYSVIPFGLRTDMEGTAPVRDRTVDCCFAGKLYNYDFYNERAAIVKSVRDRVRTFGTFEGHWGGPLLDKSLVFSDTAEVEIEEGKGYLESSIEYREMYQRSKFGINVATPYGPNFRDFEIPAGGSILLAKTWDGNNDLKRLGFRDGENCYFYETADEAAEIVRMGHDYNIAVNGWKLIHENHLYKHRMEDFNEIMEACV